MRLISLFLIIISFSNISLANMNGRIQVECSGQRVPNDCKPIVRAEFLKNNCIIDFISCNHEAGRKIICNIDSPNCSPLVQREGEVTCALPRVERELSLNRSLKIHSTLTRSSFTISYVPQSVCSDNPPYLNGGGDGAGDGGGGDGGAVTE